MPALAKLEEQALQKIGFQNILFATDFSEASQRALPYALTIARRYGSTLSIVHALGREPRVPIPLEAEPRQMDRALLEAERQMKQVVDNVRTEGIAHRSTVEHGPVWDVLRSVIQREHIDLLVVGTHGRGGLKKLVLGSVAEEVLRLAPCPVLTIGKNVATGPLNLRSILFATDFGPASEKALPYAISLAEDYGARLVFLHVIPPMPAAEMGMGVYGPAFSAGEGLTESEAASRRQAEEKLRELVLPGAKLAHEPEYVVKIDVVPYGILQVAKSRKADLIVVGASRTSSASAAAHIPWTVTHTLVCESACPVLTVAG